MLGSKSGLKKALYFGIALLMVAGVVATFSRGGFVGLICVVGMILWGSARKNRILVLALLAVFAMGFLAIVPNAYRARLSTTKDDSAVARTDDLKRSIFLTVHNPLLGVGLGNYVLFSNSSKATHNAYTQISSEVGVAGMVVYILFLVTPLRRLRAIRRESTASVRRSSLQWLALGLEAGLVGYMVNSFFASVALQWYAYYLVAYAFCLYRIIENSGLAERVEVQREYPLPLRNRAPGTVPV
jgi:O-antigen ligase